MNIDSINASTITHYVYWLENERKCSNNAINKHLTALRSFLKFCSFKSKALNFKYYELDSTIKASFRTTSGNLEYLTKEQIKLLLSLPDLATTQGKRNKLILALICTMGMRVREVLSLKNNNLIKKNDTYMFIKIESTRNKERLIPIHNIIQKLLLDYLNEFHPNLKGNDYLFFAEHHYHNDSDSKRTKLSESTVNTALKNYAQQAHSLDPSFPKSISATMLRHSCAISMLESGLSYFHLVYLLGNKTLSFLESYYKSQQKDSKDPQSFPSVLEKVISKIS